MSNYSLEVISHHPTFKNKNLRQYYIDGINTVGAWGDEPFEIRFKNNTHQKVQVKLSVDGTDVLSGDLASTEVAQNMWVVNSYSTLSLKAWPETNNGGAAFVFTNTANGVATHTHGNLSNRGIIAAAVFVEGYVEPVRLNPIVIHEHRYPTYPHYPINPIWVGGYEVTCGGTLTLDSAYSSSSEFSNKVDCVSPTRSKSLESLVAVGAGQHVDQKIVYVTGLIKPIFTESIRIKYMWWDDLVSKLKAGHVPSPHASGFPGDKTQSHINLGKTPRMGNFSGPSFPKSIEPTYSRF